ncbi:MaoC domain protein [Stutzerimonas stutzeri A1501]|uniref:MaoC domain protein n=3 Tax=Stutzerimonas stutzeri TaxID=316 RepID=A4VR12_STUS1|nr:MaoC domain protein [Stutzerimonas stutzeri A1501]
MTAHSRCRCWFARAARRADLARCQDALRRVPLPTAIHAGSQEQSGGHMPQVPVAQLKDYIGKELGHSEWLTIDQQRVDRFADCTGDHQFIHVDPEKAAQTPFGGTIAHGFLSLSLLPMLSGDLLVVPEGTRMGVNYGLDSLRFIQPVRVGSRVRLGLTLIDAHEKNPGQWLLKARAVMEIEGSEKPAYIAETLALCIL